ncbi:MAG: hypothetical protein GW911_19920 [Armatimonadetes bacterium]|nr:hypothetical protein [Armatimonadota bacterium]NDK14304.1 hypothetical protein [Armatimonadota bacterium]
MPLSDLDQHNLNELERLNQRGGRMLSLVDLVEANTLSLDMAAELASRVSAGVSLLTAAVPGGAGKTTAMAALLNFLPPGIRLVTVSSPAVLHQQHDDPVCFLPHELGSGPWFGYLWGREVARLFEATREQHLFASCLHADTLPELRAIVCSPELGVAEEDFQRLDLALFLRIRGSARTTLRRVSHAYAGSTEGGHRLMWEWDERTDQCRRCDAAEPRANALPPLLSPAAARSLLTTLAADGRRTLAEVRAAFCEVTRTAAVPGQPGSAAEDRRSREDCTGCLLNR